MIEEWSLALPMPEERAEVVDIAALVEAYASLLFRVAHSVLRNAAEAEDTVQDTFVRVMQQRRRLPEVRDMRVWLVRITWNLAQDRRRRIRPGQMDGLFVEQLVGPGPSAEQALSESEQMRRVLLAIDALPKLERQVLLLATVEELGTGEIASICGRSESAVRALLFRARTRLRERLEEGAPNTSRPKPLQGERKGGA